jgi:hypothetical protein
MKMSCRFAEDLGDLRALARGGLRFAEQRQLSHQRLVHLADLQHRQRLDPARRAIAVGERGPRPLGDRRRDDERSGRFRILQRRVAYGVRRPALLRFAP